MYQDNNNYGYWIVEYIDENGITRKDQFNTDLDAKAFYNILIKEINTP
jgi:hypothetical protein